MRRRELIAALGGASLIASLRRARAQPAPERRRVIGTLTNEAWAPPRRAEAGVFERAMRIRETLAVVFPRRPPK